MSANNFSTVFALLSHDKRAVDVVARAEADYQSGDPVVRAVIDSNTGYLSLAFARPADNVEARIIRVDTDNPKCTEYILGRTPGVERILERPLPGAPGNTGSANCIHG